MARVRYMYVIYVILPGTRGGNPVFIGETSIGSFIGGNAFGSPVGCFGGLFSSKLESEPLLLSSSIVPTAPLLVCSALAPSPFVLDWNYKM